MGVEHSFRDDKESQRCPSCGHVSTLKAGEDTPSLGMQFSITGEYFTVRILTVM